MKAIVLASAFVAIATTRADEDPAPIPAITLTVGQHVDIPASGMQVVCDDKSLVQVDDAGNAIRLTGLAPGTTLCGFRHQQQNTVYTVTVKPAPAH